MTCAIYSKECNGLIITDNLQSHFLDKISWRLILSGHVAYFEQFGFPYTMDTESQPERYYGLEQAFALEDYDLPSADLIAYRPVPLGYLRSPTVPHSSQERWFSPLRTCGYLISITVQCTKQKKTKLRSYLCLNIARVLPPGADTVTGTTDPIRMRSAGAYSERRFGKSQGASCQRLKCRFHM